jgi:hypothetical protein
MKPKASAKPTRAPSFATGVGRALRRAAKDAQKTARMYGTPIYVWEKGKVSPRKNHKTFRTSMLDSSIGDAMLQR